MCVGKNAFWTSVHHVMDLEVVITQFDHCVKLGAWVGAVKLCLYSHVAQASADGMSYKSMYSGVCAQLLLQYSGIQVV